VKTEPEESAIHDQRYDNANGNVNLFVPDEMSPQISQQL
jgi:hypothetical protein